MKKIFLTFDMEWANDEVLEYFYNLLKELNLKATILVTHSTKWLEKFRADENIELGIHPNFNKILLGEEKKHYIYENILTDLKEVVPEAISYRSHSLTENTYILNKCVELGLRYNLNYYIKPQKDTRLYPFQRNSGKGMMRVVPFIFEDDLYLVDEDRETIEFLLSDEFDMYRIFNFHPAQLYLNCENIERWNIAKQYNWEESIFATYRNNSLNWGIEQVFRKVVELGRYNGYEFALISEIDKMKV